ncbi:alpha/beta fold hydrolase [Pseudorhodoplanes sp.]|uniref:alpha/beta fold hydrolase n=1 Tax=Pseudorhodoplanes sp. TaxID=1934341 RepID=UPI003D12BA28
MLEPTAAPHAESRFIAAPDGLSLHVRCYGEAAMTSHLPVLCLPGLTRTEADFEALARRLSEDAVHPRRVFALDSRGRGRSDYDRDWRNYNLAVELGDVIAAVAALGLDRAIFVGTSRGGLLTMLLAAAQPMAIAGAVLNDIGPVVEPAGLLRIKGYVGSTPQPRDFPDAVDILRELFGAQFPNLGAADWLAWAHRSWRAGADGLVATYDTAIAETLKDVDPNEPMPALWEPFDALAPVPTLVIRGTLSDILSIETVCAMRERRGDLEAIEVSGQGHAPLLAEAPILAQIADFILRCDRAQQADR